MGGLLLRVVGERRKGETCSRASVGGWELFEGTPPVFCIDANRVFWNLGSRPCGWTSESRDGLVCGCTVDCGRTMAAPASLGESVGQLLRLLHKQLEV